MSAATDVLCAGVIVADHVCTPIDRLPAAGELIMADGMLLTIGGCAANAAVDLVRMGVAARILGRVGGDVFGRVVADLLREAGVDVSALQTSPKADTSQTLIVNVRGQDRRFVHTFGANREFTAADLGDLDGRVLYVGGYLALPGLGQEELTGVFRQARARGVKTVLDVVVPGPGDYLGRFERLLPETDVFLPNDMEAKIITGEADPLRQAEIFHRMGCGTAVVTCGGGGSVLVSEGLKLRAATYPVEYVDGSGGGDAFDAGFICGLLQGEGPEGCVRYASALGASCVRAVGTTPGVFTRAECEAFLRQHALKIERE